jgi:glycosyltransferase involved in cell wall biosynthesis
MKHLNPSFYKKTYDIVYLTTDSIQEGVGESQIVPLLRGLARSGNSLALVSFEKRVPDQILVSKIMESGIEWLPLRYGTNGAIPGFFRLLRLRKAIPSARLIHARSDIPAVAAIFRFRRTPVVWDVRSLWGSQRGMTKTKGWNLFTIFLAESLEKIAARRSQALVTLTESVVPVLLKRHKKIPTIRTVIPTSVQLEKFKPSGDVPRDIICLLSGTYNNFYDHERMSFLFGKLRESLEFKIIWARPNESSTIQMNFGEIEVLNPRYDQIPNLISQSSFSLLVLKDQDRDVLAAVAPTKIAEFLACGKPILINSGVGDLDLHLVSYKAGVVLDFSQDIEEQLISFIRIVNDPQTPINCRRLAEDLYSMEIAIGKYQKIYQEVLDLK